MFHPFEYAGPLRIPPPKMQLRVRREASTTDTVNARYSEQWQTDAPIKQSNFLADNVANIKTNEGGDMSKYGGLPFYDMAPLSSRTESRDYRQAQPYIPTGPSLAQNPFFDRYDPTRDPRNMIREVRSAVYEDKDADRGIEESKRLLERGLTNRWVPEGSSNESMKESLMSYDMLRPKMDDITKEYRSAAAAAKAAANKGQT
jgi:hypothetical protein